ncbi:MAG: HD domain-containing protein [Desulfobacteraceae bacterium]|nr:HD domain-containing protein [Desulfobacteraceae bacterium]
MNLRQYVPAMSDYIQIKHSQIDFYHKIPLFYKTEDNEYHLYKKKGEPIAEARLETHKHPPLFILQEDKRTAAKELQESLNIDLARQIASKGVKTVKSIVGRIVAEALEDPCPKTLDSLPDTIEIFFAGHAKNSELLKAMTMVASGSSLIIDHTVNVLAIATRFCFCNKLGEDTSKKIALGALLHDIGTAEISQKILEVNRRLTDAEFDAYKSHPLKGCDIINRCGGSFDPMVAEICLEHHERIDGSGYPMSSRNISFQSQLVGLIDSYEPLTYRDKTFRKAKTPFDTLQLLKHEVLEGKFDKSIFRNLCSCMTS